MELIIVVVFFCGEKIEKMIIVMEMWLKFICIIID